MLKRDEIANPDSCLNRAAADEPVFVLRANDPTAPAIVRAWVNAYAYRKKGLKAMDSAEIGKHNEALQIAQAMENYKRSQGTRDRAEKRGPPSITDPDRFHPEPPDAA